MADPTAVYSLISGIGGALVGGFAGAYGPVLIDKRRGTEKGLAAVADATVAVQEWHRLITWTLQDLQTGRQVDITAFSEAAESVMRSVVETISLSSGSLRSKRWRGRTQYSIDDGGRRSPVTLAMHQATFDLRHQLLAPDSDFNIDGTFIATVNRIRDDLMRVYMTKRARQVGSPIAVGTEHLDADL